MFGMSITKRWLYSTIVVITLILLCVAAMVSFVFKDYYHDYAKDRIYSISQSTSIANYFSAYLNADKESFANCARSYVEDFDYSNLCEVWVLDREGEVIVTSTGFMPKETQCRDYDAALLSSSGKGEWTGEFASGETVFALTVLLPKTDGINNGAVRFITSLDDIDRQWHSMNILISAVCVFALLLVFFSGWFFIRSIVKPVNLLNDVTKRIAAGDFAVRTLSSDRDDEIGELCRSIDFMTEELARTDKLKNDFISTVSHELRTPLTAIKGWTETLRDVPADDTQIFTSGLRVIANETERLYSLVEDLLDFSKIESGRMTLRLTLIDALAELDMAVYVFKDRAEREGITIEYESPEFAAPMMGDADRLKQVFVNVLDNAVKYTSVGGVIRVSAMVENEQLIVCVQDNGCGISAEALPHVKEKFYKSNLSAKGSGIGLAVSDEIVTRHGGSIEISSRQNVGTLVAVRLPLAAEKEQDGKDS